MRTCPWKCVVLLLAAFFTLSALIYGRYDLDFIYSDGRVIQQRLLTVTDSSLPLYKESGEATTAPPEDEQVMPCSLRQTVQQDPLLQQRFNFSVPVLQWAGHSSVGEWQRLQLYPPPYGWKGLPWDVVNSTLALLSDPQSSSRLLEHVGPRPCVRCAVVGNGGILRGSGQGGAIDAHHYVFRVNGAVTKGFEEDVGTKTSFYGFTTNTMKNSLISYRAAGFLRVPQGQGIHYIFIPSDMRDYRMLAAAIRGAPVTSGEDRGDLPSTYFGQNPSVHQFKLLHPDFITYVKDRFLKSPLLRMMYGHLYMPSTGALMLMTALHTCDQVSAYGFITDNYKDFSDHYFDMVKKPLVFYANHDMQMESRLWEQLHTRKVLWLFKRPSEE
ncbi:alpha-N-acetylgalactosaminide alpha-2,6-sialyltransferase 2 isoform X2 [Megalops cyprinoides]|uniref:alpha-N-acetylgalactosaminide alpha-2,6-sialyltransferase 2 isoform X2 n=1 Tax=Megalops cyprinoides TaxID=118141 RepID=UPI001863AC94|nr:alpha-N-acetylgalactosaminide alpha-2,6-sialyltransferase 2 isoform X2 [Megalops cyprinoides]